ncbi:auxin-responsive protein SAUR78-like [Andrographis paniculata]|uniref:auxin-responsive protein SAUR78-like n=1 Tax=Andrographis paniculata TaxID=175694 RepID=UPI0021E783FB|nr:auxin-responsive protein SAUR78-like [Andrographis paniculata]
MAKGATLTRIKSVLKKVQSIKLSRGGAGGGVAVNNVSDEDESFVAAKDLHAVYVGKSRRRYLITSDVLENPLLRELVERRRNDGEAEEEEAAAAEEAITVGCEVVLFEHLLWMLENADPMPESLDELAEFYSC